MENEIIQCSKCEEFYSKKDVHICINLEQRLSEVLKDQRAKERIPLILALLAKIWTKNPDLRLAQLIRNCVIRDMQLKFIEDDELVEKLIRTYLEKKRE